MKVSQSVFFLAAVSTAVLAHPGDLYHGGYGHGVDHHHAYPRYDFNYGVHSAHTGDVKNQWEARDGDLVKGSYSLNEADGTVRQVEYTADKHNGFNAVVKKLGHAVHPHTVRHYGGAGYGGASLYGGAHDGGAHYGGLGTSSYAGQYPGSYYGTQKLGGAFLGAGHLGSATSYASGNLRSFGHYGGGHLGGHLGGATSHANSNSIAISHHGGPRYAVGHLGATSYASGYNGAVAHYGNHHNY